mmetsp:Transcript_7908/g.28837  ORF Transcript_7908/g.28837 Transcript_7908/m.28837 type:complete len:247 (+) Transcript_7908:1827-2567(+)
MGIESKSKAISIVAIMSQSKRLDELGRSTQREVASEGSSSSSSTKSARAEASNRRSWVRVVHRSNSRWAALSEVVASSSSPACSTKVLGARPNVPVPPADGCVSCANCMREPGRANLIVIAAEDGLVASSVAASLPGGCSTNPEAAASPIGALSTSNWAAALPWAAVPAAAEAAAPASADSDSATTAGASATSAACPTAPPAVAAVGTLGACWGRRSRARSRRAPQRSSRPDSCLSSSSNKLCKTS